MSLTIADLIERTYRTYLYPPDYEPALVQLDGSIDDTQLTAVVGSFLVPEDEELLRIGSLVEFDQELVRITGFDSTTRVLTLAFDPANPSDRKAQRGTTAAAHNDGIYAVLTPSYPRLSVFEAIRDNITMLSPQLFSVGIDNLVQVTNRVAGIEDDLAVEVLEVWADNIGDTTDYHARIVDNHPAIGGRALITNMSMGTLWVRYRRRMGVPDEESELLTDLGVESVWEVVVMCGVAADLLAPRDLPQSQVEYIGATLQAENIRVGTRLSVAGGLAQYRDILIKRFQAEMKNEYRVKIRMRDPFDARASRDGFG
jgi:hypothetical protein